MGDRRWGSVRGHLRVLMDGGALGGLTDRELLDRFCGRDAVASETAFTALVERHGPMVLRVCRAVLNDEHAASDAFQATFLVLARRARAVWVRDSLGPWLHGVAYRTAACSRSAEQRRRRHEHGAASAKLEACSNRDEWDDVGVVLHEEVTRLPERYRAPVVLCYLEGLTHDQAALRLGWPVGTVRTRLSKARERLRSRLTQRGVVPATAVGSLLVASEARAAVLSWSLVNVTVQAGLQAGASGTAVGILVSTIPSLFQGAMHTMVLHKVQFTGLALLFMATGAVVSQRPGWLPSAQAQATSAVTGTGERGSTAGAADGVDEETMTREMKRLTLEVFDERVNALRREMKDAISTRMDLERQMAQGKDLAPLQQQMTAEQTRLEDAKRAYLLAVRERDAAWSRAEKPMAPAADRAKPSRTAPADKPREAEMRSETSPAGGTGMAVGTVDVDRVMKECMTLRESKQQIEAEVRKRREHLNGINSAVQQMGSVLSKTTPGTPDYDALERRMVREKQSYETERELAQRELSEKESREVAAFYERIQDVVAKVARAKGLTYVVRVYPKVSLSANSSGVADALNREVLYADSRYDLTDDVIRELNEKQTR